MSLTIHVPRDTLIIPFPTRKSAARTALPHHIITNKSMTVKKCFEQGRVCMFHAT